jgi:uncharacterized protein (TIGR01777 family)
MQFGITGSTGLVGAALASHLEARGHDVVRLHRGDGPAQEGAPSWDPEAGRVTEGALDGCDVVVSLGGASIGEGRWNASRKRELRASRIEATRLLVEHLAGLPRPPRAFMSASAVGYYGDRADELLEEGAARGEGFLADLVADWEAETLRAGELGMRAVALRFGVVLSAEGGALPRMLPPFRLGLGGRLGSGRQWISWITLQDAARAIEFAARSDLAGAVNVTAPGAVTNAEFTRALARALHRPARFPVPRRMLRLAVGEAADELLLASTRAVPTRLQSAGFRFDHPELEAALAAVLGARSVEPAADPAR